MIKLFSIMLLSSQLSFAQPTASDLGGAKNKADDIQGAIVEPTPEQKASVQPPQPVKKEKKKKKSKKAAK